MYIYLAVVDNDTNNNFKKNITQCKKKTMQSWNKNI